MKPQLPIDRPAMTPPPTHPPTHPPAIPNYRLLRRIGRGTYGEVWLGLDVFNHWAAVKVVRQHPGESPRNHDQEFRGLERYTTVAGSHPGLVRVKNIGKDPSGTFFYYDMEPADDAITGLPLPRLGSGLVDLAEAQGAADVYQPLTLTEKLRSGRLTPQECVRHGLALAEALAYLHEHHLVHRDVKPSNIIMVEGRAKLADVGLVSRFDATLVSLAGTPDYVPLHGAGKPTGDLFALGKVLYLMANGRPLADFPELLTGWELLPDAERTALAELSAIYDKACEPEPTDRYARAEELRAELEWLRREESVLALRRREAEVSRREAQFRRWRRGLVVAVVVTALAGLAFAALSWRATTMRRAALAELEKRQLARITRRMQGWAERDWQAIRQAIRGQPDDALVRQASATLAGLDVRRLGHWSGVEGTSAAFSPAGELVLSGYGTQHASLITRGTNRSELPVAGEGKVGWALDGEPLIFQVEAGKAVLREARTGHARREFPLAAGEAGLAFHAPVTTLSADGSLAAAVLAKGEARRLAIWDSATGALLGETNLTASVLAFTPDGSRLAAGHEDGSVSVFGLRPFSRGAVLPAALGPNPVQALAFGPDALVPLAGLSEKPRWLLAVGDRATGIVIWELAAARPRAFCRGSTWEVQGLAFHPDGVTLVSSGRRGVRFWAATSGQLLLATGDDGSNSSNTRALAFSADGSRLAAGSTSESARADISLWELEPDRGIRQLRGLAAPVRKITYSPDGKRLAALSDEWRLAVWEVPAGRLLRILEVPAGIYADGVGRAFDPTHRFLAFAAGTSARLFDLESGQAVAAWELPEGQSDELQFTPEGRIILGRLEPDIDPPRLRRWCLYELSPGQPARELHRQIRSDETTVNVTLTAGAARLLVFGRDRQTHAAHLILVAVDTGQERWRRELGNTIPWQVPRVDPTGTHATAIFGSSETMALLGLSDGEPITTVGDCWGLGPGGIQFAAGGLATTQWQVHDGPGRRPGLLFASDSGVTPNTLTFSPQGDRIAWGNDEGVVFVAEPSEVRRRLAGLVMPGRNSAKP
jgi:WD40 repeat protein